MNTQPPCPNPPLPPFPGLYFAILDFTHLPRILSLSPQPPPPPLPPPPPSPALAPDEGGRGRGPQSLFRGNRARDLVMEGFIHTTGLARLYKPQAVSPRLSSLPPSSLLVTRSRNLNFTRLPNGAETSPRKAQDPPPSPRAPSHHPPAPFPRPQNLFRDSKF